MSAPLDVLAVMLRVSDELRGSGVSAGRLPAREHRNHLCEWGDDIHRARAAVAELVSKSERVAATLEMPALARQSTKNANAGFIDWRDWCALKGEVADLRATLAKFEVTP